MFTKKDVLYSEKLGVCYVHDITKLTDDQGNVMDYYVLKNVFQKSKVAYIPVDKHQVMLRELITEIEARQLYEEAKKNKQFGMMEAPQKEEIAYLLKEKPETLVDEEEEA